VSLPAAFLSGVAGYASLTHPTGALIYDTFASYAWLYIGLNLLRIDGHL
jgi:hypothetical protein